MSRKYRQRGYQDEATGDRDRDRSPEARERPRRDRLRPDRPGGRGLGSPGREVFRCADCGAEQGPPEGTAATCEACGSALHTCTNCRYFSSGARFQCTQPVPAPIRSKGKANECDLFAPKIAMTHDEGVAEPTDGRSAFDALFDKL